MKKLKMALCGTLALMLTSFTTPVLAGASDFAGPYIAFHGAAHGFQLDGEHKDSNGIVTKGTGGFTTPVAGLELGYNIPIGSTFFVDIGARWVNSDGQVNADDVEDASDVTLASGDHYTVTISPNVTLNDNSSVFLKLGYSEMDIDATGDITNASTALPANFLRSSS